MNRPMCQNNSSANFHQITDSSAIYKLLCQFENVFPHLREKIDNFECYADKLSRYALCYECIIAENTVGMLVFYANDFITRKAYISLIGVLPQWQGKGLGSVLLNHCIAVSLNQGMKTLQLEVDNDNTGGIHFYQKHGFIIEKQKGASSKILSKCLDNETNDHNSYRETDA